MLYGLYQIHNREREFGDGVSLPHLVGILDVLKIGRWKENGHIIPITFAPGSASRSINLQMDQDGFRMDDRDANMRVVFIINSLLFHPIFLFVIII